MRLVLGVDAGATATKLALTDGELRPLATHVAPMMLPCFLPMAEVKSLLSSAVEAVASAGGCRPDAIEGICLGVSGCDRSGERDSVARMVAEVLPQARVLVTHDAVVALAGGCGRPEGIAVVAGTGSIAFGRHTDGRTARAGGGGALLSDEGSGYDLGRRALAAVFRAADGRGPETDLSALVLGRLGLPDAASLIPWSRGEGQAKAAVADLAPLVFEAAQRGDEVADSLVIHAAAELALMAHCVARPLWPPEKSVEVAMMGQLFGEQPILRRRFIALLEAMQPSLQPVSPRATPAEGACAYGLHIWRGAAKVPGD